METGDHLCDVLTLAGQEPLRPDPNADQNKPRRSYVYAHEDPNGNFFYIGKGTGRRAWSKDRDQNWHWHVEKHLAGVYSVRILADDLSSEAAELLESVWIEQCAEGLVNWASPGRYFDYPALERYHALRNANRALLEQAQATENVDLERAAHMYWQVVEAAVEYESIVTERGLVSRLVAEQNAANGITGICGEMWAIRRLVECLIGLGRPTEAKEQVARYLEVYQADANHHYWPGINKKIETALAREDRKKT